MIFLKHKSIFLIPCLLFIACFLSPFNEPRLTVAGSFVISEINGITYSSASLYLGENLDPEAVMVYLNDQRLSEDTCQPVENKIKFQIPEIPVPGKEYNLRYETDLGNGNASCWVPCSFKIVTPIDSVPRNSTVYLQFTQSAYADTFDISVYGAGADTFFDVTDTTAIVLGPEFTADGGEITINIAARNGKAGYSQEPYISWFGEYRIFNELKVY